MTIKLSTGARNAIAGPTGFGATFANGVIYVRHAVRTPA